MQWNYSENHTQTLCACECLSYTSATNYMFQISHWLQLEPGKLESFDCQISVSWMQQSKMSPLMRYKTE